MRVAVIRLAAAAILGATTWIPVASQSRLRPAIPFISTRDNPAGTLANASEIYLMDADIAPERFRLTVDDIKRYGPGIVVDYGSQGTSASSCG